MYLARIRSGSSDEVHVAVRMTGQAPGDASDRLVILDDVPNADPVALVMERGVEAISEQVRSLVDRGAPVHPADAVIFEPPIASCSKICCLALNYADHAHESQLEVPPRPVLFFKPPSALVGHRAKIRPPSCTRHVEHEVELGVVIGRRARDVPADQWQNVVAGYTVINDLTARDLQVASMQRGEPWDRSKCFDTFAPIGPYLVTPDDVGDPENLDLRLEIGGQVRQSANTSQMVFKLSSLIADLTDGMTLLPGDVIATGTTAGIAPVRDGDVMRASVQNVGVLENQVAWA